MKETRTRFGVFQKSRLRPKRFALLTGPGQYPASSPNQQHHLLDYRLSLGLGPNRFYFRLLLGRERRNVGRLRNERQLDASKASIFISAVLLLILGSAAFGAIIILYVAKSAMGIDLLDGPSPFHDLFY